MIPIEVQFQALIAMTLFGFAMGICFDIYRELRGILRLKPRATNVGDLVVWLIFLVAAYMVLLYTNYGQVRLFIFMAIALGLLIYFRLFSRFLRKPIHMILLAILKVLSLIWKVLRIPLALVLRVLMLPANLISLLVFKLISPVKRIKSSLKARLGKKNTD